MAHYYVDRRLLQIAISDAQVAGVKQQTIGCTMNQLNEGDADVMQTEFAEAIADYAEAWRIALWSSR